jgi:hypothetical protein
MRWASFDTADITLRTCENGSRSLVQTLDACSVRYAIIGGIATIQHGRVRTTADIDVLLTVPQLVMPAFFTSLQNIGFVVDVNRNIVELRDDGLTTVRFGEILVDMMRPVLPAFSHVLDRAVPTEILGQIVRISDVEGLIVMKLIAFRPQDEADIRDLLAAYRGELDLAYVRSEFASVADANDSRWGKLEDWIRERRDT